MKIKPLPPLNSLVAFESAARHLSFTQAATELNVTQGAISRQIRLLEDYLGRSLFVRDKRQLALTQTGEDYFNSVQQSLLLLASAVSHQFCHDSIRSPEEVQSSGRYLELRMQSPCLGAAIEVSVSSISGTTVFPRS